MIDALLYSIRDGIRAAGFNYGNAECEITDGGRPTPRCGNWFVSVHDGIARSSRDNQLFEEYDFGVTISARAASVSIDRIGDQLIARNLVRNPLGNRQGVNAKAEQLGKFLHMNWERTVLTGRTPNSANDNLSAWETGTVYGFCEPMRYKGYARISVVGADWFGDDPEQETIGLKAELRFEGCKRFQPQIAASLAESTSSAWFVAPNNTFLNRVSGSLLSPGASDFGFSGWVYFNSLPTTGNQMTLLAKWFSTGNIREYKLAALNNAGTTVFQWSISPDGTTTANLLSGVTLTTGVWYHVLCSFGDNGDGNGHGLRVYVNGGNKVFAGQIGNLFAGMSDFELGANNNGASNLLDGGLARVAYWNYPPTDADVAVIYNSGRSQLYSQLSLAQQARLIEYWNLNELSGTRYGSTQNHLNLSDHGMVTQDGGPP